MDKGESVYFHGLGHVFSDLFLAGERIIHQPISILLHLLHKENPLQHWV